jgi:prepilin-type processing-associated H-X9-DG protein
MSQSNGPSIRVREVIVLVAIIGVVVALAVPAVQRIRDAAESTACAGTLMQIGVGVHSTNDLYKVLPPVNSTYPRTSPIAGTVLYHVMPFVQSRNLYKLANDSDWLTDPVKHRFDLFHCSSDPSSSPLYAQSNYSPNYFVFLNEPGGSTHIWDFLNGSAYTLVISERRRTCIKGGGSWSKRDRNYGAWVENTEVFQSQFDFADGGDNGRWHRIHRGGINVLMLDGGVFFIDPQVDPATWQSWAEAKKGPIDPLKVQD